MTTDPKSDQPTGRTVTLRIEDQPTGQVDVVAYPDSKGVRPKVVARCLNRHVATVLAKALAADTPANPTEAPAS